MSSNRVNLHRQEVIQLKTQFEKLQQEMIIKFKECTTYIESAERLNEEALSMTKNLEDSLANVTNEAKEWQEIKVKLASTAIKGKVILDVGGDRYTTSVETLTREKETFFTALFSRQWQLECDPKDGSIFIDRNGKLFSYILEYLRTDLVPDDVVNNKSLRQSLIVEAKYFHLHKLIDILTKPERKEEIERLNIIFPNTTLLSKEHEKKLNAFYGNNEQKWELIYKASRDGFDANTFHSRCDNKGPTMTIVQSNNNYLFGGYTSVAWTSSPRHVADSNAFLFTLTNPHNIPPTKYPIQPLQQQKQYATYHHINYGPTFGAAGDLCIMTSSNSNNSSYTAFPSTYNDTTGKGNSTFTGNLNFTTSDIEVFKHV